MKLRTILAGLFILVGMALVLPGAIMWDSLQIQAGLGKATTYLTHKENHHE